MVVKLASAVRLGLERLLRSTSHCKTNNVIARSDALAPRRSNPKFHDEIPITGRLLRANALAMTKCIYAKSFYHHTLLQRAKHHSIVARGFTQPDLSAHERGGDHFRWNVH